MANRYWRARVYASGGYGRAPRRKPSVKVQQEILLKQSHRCAYCERSFATEVKVCWDHFLPWVVFGNRGPWIASCFLCNSVKHDLYFESVEQAQLYIVPRIREILGDESIQTERKSDKAMP